MPVVCFFGQLCTSRVSFIQRDNDDLFVCFWRHFFLTGCPWRSQSCSQHYHLHKSITLTFSLFLSQQKCQGYSLIFLCQHVFHYFQSHTRLLIPEQLSQRSHADSHFLPRKCLCSQILGKSSNAGIPGTPNLSPFLEEVIFAIMRYLISRLLNFCSSSLKKFFQVFSYLMIAENIDENIWYVIQSDRCSPHSYCRSGATKVHVHYIWNGNE